MEAILLFVLLFFSVENGRGIPIMLNVSGNRTWNEAANDSTCSMIGLNLEGDVEGNIDKISSIARGTHQTAWIGAHARRVWMDFDGCYYGILNCNATGIAMTSSGDPAKTCLLHCNYSRFVLTDDTCVCYDNVKLTSSDCTVSECSNTRYSYCGKGTALNSQNRLFPCMCRFSMENDSRYIFGDDNCLAVTYKPQHFIALNCSYTYMPLCHESNYESNITRVHPTGIPNTWLQSLSECYYNSKQFAGRTTSWAGNHNGTYWVGVFAVTYTLWGHTNNANDSCVAVNIDGTDNHLTPAVLPCDTLLPAVCINTSISNNYSDAATESSSSCKNSSINNSQLLVSTYDKPTTEIVTKKNEPSATSVPGVFNDRSDILNGGQTKRPVPLIVGSIAGSIVGVIICVAVVLFLRRHGTFRKRPIETDTSPSQVVERNSWPVNNSDSDAMEMNASELPLNAGVHVYENMKVRNSSKTETPKGCGDTELHTERDNESSGFYINASAMYQPDLLALRNQEGDYCGLTRPSHDEHEYGQLQ